MLVQLWPLELTAQLVLATDTPDVLQHDFCYALLAEFPCGRCYVRQTVVNISS